MPGCRPLTPAQERAVVWASRRLSPRDHLVICLLMFAGLRNTILPRLRFGDVWRNGSPVKTIFHPLHPNQRHRRERLEYPVLPELRRSIQRYVTSMIAEGELIADDLPLLRGRTLDGKTWRPRPLTRRQVHRIVQRAFRRAKLEDVPRLAPMSLRKTLGRKVLAATGDLLVVRDVLGHASVSTTCDLLEIGRAAVEQAIVR